MNAIEVEGLKKTYEQFQLGELSFCIPAGSIVGFVGENGAGKTTTIKSLLGLLRPDQGKVQILGKEPNQKDGSWKEHIGVVLDSCRFPDNMTAQHIGRMMKEIYKTWDGKKYEDYLSLFDIPRERRVKDLSRGMGMKLTLAVALSHDTKLLILDEATSGLDPVIRNEILDIFLDFVQDEEHTIFLSSHITSDIEKIADYILMIHQGKIILYENKDTLLYEYGVVKCAKDQVEEIPKTEVIGTREYPHDVEMLVKNRNIPLPEGAVMDRVNLDELLLFMIEKRGKVR